MVSARGSGGGAIRGDIVQLGLVVEHLQLHHTLLDSEDRILSAELDVSI